MCPQKNVSHLASFFPATKWSPQSLARCSISSGLWSRLEDVEKVNSGGLWYDWRNLIPVQFPFQGELCHGWFLLWNPLWYKDTLQREEYFFRTQHSWNPGLNLSPISMFWGSSFRIIRPTHSHYPLVAGKHVHDWAKSLCYLRTACSQANSHSLWRLIHFATREGWGQPSCVDLDWIPFDSLSTSDERVVGGILPVHTL